MPLSREHNGHARNGSRPGIQAGDGLAGGQPADVHAGDPHAGCDPVRGTREGEPDEKCARDSDRGQDQQPAYDQPPRARAPAVPNAHGARTCFNPQDAESSGRA